MQHRDLLRSIVLVASVFVGALLAPQIGALDGPSGAPTGAMVSELPVAETAAPPAALEAELSEHGAHMADETQIALAR